MQIETYEVEEIQGEMGNMAADSEAAELIEKLGLDGQRELLHPETCTRFPYRKMTKREHKIFSLLFPVRTELARYSDGIIPIRVLQVAAFVRDLAGAPCPHLKVWHCHSAKEDPLLVGHSSEYGGEFYLLARWGDAILSVDELAQKALGVWTAKARSKLAKETAEIEQDIKNLDAIAAEVMATGEATSAANKYELDQIT